MRALLATNTPVTASSALVSSSGFLHTSSGFIGLSDGWTDLQAHYQLTWSYLFVGSLRGERLFFGDVGFFPLLHEHDCFEPSDPVAYGNVAVFFLRPTPNLFVEFGSEPSRTGHQSHPIGSRRHRLSLIAFQFRSTTALYDRHRHPGALGFSPASAAASSLPMLSYNSEKQRAFTS
jgi:Glucodextranase, domain N